MSVYATGKNVSGVDNIFKTTHPSIGVFIEDALGEKLNGITKPRATALPQPGSMTFALKAGLMKTGNEEMKTGSFSYNVAVVIDVTHF